MFPKHDCIGNIFDTVGCFFTNNVLKFITFLSFWNFSDFLKSLKCKKIQKIPDIPFISFFSNAYFTLVTNSVTIVFGV